jgi:hypothetical protein
VRCVSVRVVRQGRVDNFVSLYTLQLSSHCHKMLFAGAILPSACTPRYKFGVEAHFTRLLETCTYFISPLYLDVSGTLGRLFSPRFVPRLVFCLLYAFTPSKEASRVKIHHAKIHNSVTHSVHSFNSGSEPKMYIQ